MGFPDGRVVKNLPSMQEMEETWVLSLGGEDPFEEEMAKPLQYTCLRNPTDRGAWWATVHGVSEESGTDIGTKQQLQQLYKFKVCSIMI